MFGAKMMKGFFGWGRGGATVSAPDGGECSAKAT